MSVRSARRRAPTQRPFWAGIDRDRRYIDESRHARLLIHPAVSQEGAQTPQTVRGVTNETFQLS